MKKQVKLVSVAGMLVAMICAMLVSCKGPNNEEKLAALNKKFAEQNETLTQKGYSAMQKLEDADNAIGAGNLTDQQIKDAKTALEEYKAAIQNFLATAKEIKELAADKAEATKMVTAIENHGKEIDAVIKLLSEANTTDKKDNVKQANAKFIEALKKIF